MLLFFIDTYVGQAKCLDLVGTKFASLDEATKTAFTALLDIALDENEFQTALGIVVTVRAADGTEVFRACLATFYNKAAEQTRRRHCSETSWNSAYTA